MGIVWSFWKRRLPKLLITKSAKVAARPDAGFVVASFDRTLDRSGSPPSGKKRGVYIDAAMAGYVQNCLRQDQAISHHDEKVGFKCGKIRNLF